MSFKRTSVVAAMVLAFGGLSEVAPAQQRQADVDIQAGPARVTVNTNQDADQNARHAKAPTGLAFRASGITGMKVRNAAGDELGTVKDLVIDVVAGKVDYAALSYGGVLGMGDKLFAVPWGAFRHHHDADEDEHLLVLNIEESTLKQAPGFDDDSWPNFTDPDITNAYEKHYGKFEDRRAASDADSTQRRAAVDVQAGAAGVDVDVTRDRERTRELADRSAGQIKQRASEIMDMDVLNSQREEIGSVDDIVIDIDSGHARYAAISYGGFLGMGDKLFAVPWKALDCQYDQGDEEYVLVLAVDAETLKQAPGFDKDNWPDMANPKFGAEIDKYYENTRRSSSAVNPNTDRTPGR